MPRPPVEVADIVRAAGDSFFVGFTGPTRGASMRQAVADVFKLPLFFNVGLNLRAVEKPARPILNLGFLHPAGFLATRLPERWFPVT